MTNVKFPVAPLPDQPGKLRTAGKARFANLEWRIIAMLGRFPGVMAVGVVGTHGDGQGSVSRAVRRLLKFERRLLEALSNEEQASLEKMLEKLSHAAVELGNS